MTDDNGRPTDLLTKPVSRRGALRAARWPRARGRRLLGWQRQLERDRDDQGGSSSTVDHVGSTTTTTTGIDRGHGHRLLDHPRGDRRSVPGRRLERSRRAERERCRPQGHPHELRRHERDRRGRALHDPVHGRRRRPGVQAARPAPPSTCGTATARATTRCTRARRRPTTCAACRRSTRTASCPSPASSPRATRVAGRTCTSRCTRASTTRRAASDKLATSQIALPKDVCDAVYATSGYEQSVSQPRRECR